MSDVTQIEALMQERTRLDTELAERKKRREEINQQLADLVSGKQKRAKRMA